MCRNIRQLHNFDPPANEHEVRDAALQYVRKISGATKPSQANAAVFERAIEEIALSELTGALEILPAHVCEVGQRPSETAARFGRVRLSVFVCTHDLESRPAGRGRTRAHGRWPRLDYARAGR